MPSGAKKRKATKRKMDNNNNYATHSNVVVNNQTMNGDDEPKQLSSFTEEGDKVERRPSVRSNVSESNLQKELNHDGENLQEGGVEEDFNQIEDSNGKISNIGSEKESHDGSSSESCTSSSSDDESHVIEKVETSPPLDSNEEIDYAPQEVNDSVKETEDFTSSELASSNVSERNLQKELNHDGENLQEGVEEGFVQIEDSNGKISTIDSEKESHDISSSDNSTSSSSNDESHVIEKVETSPPLDSIEEINYAPQEVNDPVKETEDFVDSDKIVIHDYAIESDDASSDDEKAVDSNKPMQEETEVTDIENLGSSIESDIDVEEKNVAETAPVNAVDEINEIAPHVEPTRSEEFNHLVEETISVLASINVPMLKKIVNVNESDSVDNSVTSFEAVESVSNENGEKNNLSMDDIAEVPSRMMDVQIENQNGEMNESVVEVPPRMMVVQIENQNGEMDESVLVQMNENDLDNHESSDSQPLLDSARRTVHTTSWKNCCGIFELFKGGNR